MNVDAIFGSIGQFSVRFRWLMALVWIIGAAAAMAFLPSLSSVTQNDNTKFLPASAPVEKATVLAAPLGPTNLVPVPVVAARATGPLTAADTAAIARLEGKLRTVSSVRRVTDLGASQPSAANPGQAVQLVVLVTQFGNDQAAATRLVDHLRTKIASAGLPAGLNAHLAGNLAVEVDQQKANGNQGSRIQILSVLFIIVLLVLIFRS